MTRADSIQIAASRLLNAIINGDPSEMLSTRAYRLRSEKPLLYKVLNAMFFWQADHCKESYDWEMSTK